MIGNKISFSAIDKTLGEIIFSENIKYRVPRYQRPYTWELDQINEFWSDLCQSGESLFIGSLIFNYETLSEEGYVDIIDGQQRIITALLFMCVLRDIAVEIGDNKCAARIHTKCIVLTDRRGNETYRVLSGDTTKEFLEENIFRIHTNVKDIKINTKEEKRLKMNYLELKDKITCELEKYNGSIEKIEKIYELWDKIAEIKIIQIKIENEEDAYEIFETVNARGAELSVADLLKNYIFKNIKIKEKKELEKTQDKWKQIVENVDETNTDLTKFLRYFWMSKYSFSTEKKLFKEIKKQILDYGKFLNDLVNASELYRKMIVSQEDEWIDIVDGNKIFSSLKGLKMMGVTQCYVLFLSILRNLDKLNFSPKYVFEIVEKFTYLYSSVCNLPTNKIEKIYSKYALKLEKILTNGDQNDKNKDPHRVFSEFKEEIIKLKPVFSVFEANYMDLSYGGSEKNKKIISYSLLKINDFTGTGEHNINYNNVNIEHLLPKKPDRDWELDKIEIKDYVDKLGNLTLVHKKINSKIGNSKIEKKLPLLKGSEIAMTKKVVNEIIENKLLWDKNKILNRQKEFAKESYFKIWKLD